MNGYIERIATITDRPTHYHGWPTLALGRDGELLAVCSGSRQGHVCPFGRLELIRSSDGGNSWGGPVVLHNSTIDDRDAGIMQTPAGTWIATWFTSMAWKKYGWDKMQAALAAGTQTWAPEQMEPWRRIAEAATEEVVQRELGVWAVRSEDGGKTWSKPIDTLVNSPHGPVVLQDGNLLYAGKDLWRGGQCLAAGSQDDGRSWQALGEIPLREGDELGSYHELHAVQAADGRIIVHIRDNTVRNYGDRVLQCESSDMGQTWSVPREIGVQGSPSHLLRLQDDRLLMSYGHRRRPHSIQARVSEDHGQTWSEPMVVAGAFDTDMGYPSTVQMVDGTLRTLWYEAPGRDHSPLAIAGQTGALLPSEPDAAERIRTGRYSLSQLRMAYWRIQ
jgi:hypothetical protein